MNTDELLYLVDEDDNEIGTVIRSAANSNPNYIHREVGILIYDSNYKVLMQKRAATKKVFPNVWMESVGGHITYGMDAEDSAHKELKEELGFETNLIFFTKMIHHFPNETHITSWYIGRYRDEQIKLDKEEGSTFEFFSKPEALKHKDNFLPNLADIFPLIWDKNTLDLLDRLK